MLRLSLQYLRRRYNNLLKLVNVPQIDDQQIEDFRTANIEKIKIFVPRGLNNFYTFFTPIPCTYASSLLNGRLGINFSWKVENQ